MSKLNREQAEALASDLQTYFDHVKPPSERTKLDNFAFNQACRLERAVDNRLHEIRQQSSWASESSRITSAVSDHLGR